MELCKHDKTVYHKYQNYAKQWKTIPIPIEVRDKIEILIVTCIILNMILEIPHRINKRNKRNTFQKDANILVIGKIEYFVPEKPKIM